ncbi:MAG: hypothetical protein ACJ74W_00805 [Pyrinomonadaceae bacterium]
MKVKTALLSLIVAALAAGLSAPTRAVAPRRAGQAAQKSAPRQEDKKEQDTERRVRMRDLPAPVQQTVREQSKGAVIRGLAQETEAGLTNYEVELRVNGHTKDVLIDPTGAVVEIEEQVALASLPPAARAAIEQQAGKGKIGVVESITKAGAVVAYEAHVRKARKTLEIKVDPNGQAVTP